VVARTNSAKLLLLKWDYHSSLVQLLKARVSGEVAKEPVHLMVAVLVSLLTSSNPLNTQELFTQLKLTA
jgi:hypothetical protein